MDEVDARGEPAGRSVAAFERLLQKLADAADDLLPEQRTWLMGAVIPELEATDRLRVEVREEDLFTEVELKLIDRIDAEIEAPARAGAALTLIVKGTRLCNLRCSYCNDWRAGPDQSMRLPVLAHVIARALRQANATVVDFVWHGGETTMMPLRFYQQALYLQSRFKQPGQLVRNELQTNATRITPAWAQFFADYGFSIGISLDGPPAVHDVHRRYVSGKGSSADVMQGVKTLRAHGVEPSVLMVIDEAAYELGTQAIFDFFRAADIPRFGLLAAKPSNQPAASPSTPTEHYIEPGRFTAFLAEMSDIWAAHGDPRIQIRELEVLRNRIARTHHRPCTLTGDCLGNYFLVEPSGEVAHCDLFLGDPAYTLGNILTDSFARMRAGERLATLQEANRSALERMRSCRHIDTCHGWCPHERYASARHDADHREDCCGLEPLITHLEGLTTAAGRHIPTDVESPDSRSLTTHQEKEELAHG